MLSNQIAHLATHTAPPRPLADPALTVPNHDYPRRYAYTSWRRD